MPTSSTVASHIERAVRFVTDEPEVWVGYAKQQPWTDDAAPPAVDTSVQGFGTVDNEVRVGATLNSTNCVAKLNRTPFTGGVETYRITALTASTYEVRKVAGNVIQGSASYAAQAAARTNIIPGVSITVSATGMTAGNAYTFRVDGPVAFALASTVSLVVEDADAAPEVSVLHKGTRYRLVDPADAHTEGARMVYVAAAFPYDEVPVVPYRQVGVFTQLTRGGGAAPEAALLEVDDVASIGVLELVENRSPVYRDIDDTNAHAYLLFF